MHQLAWCRRLLHQVRLESLLSCQFLSSLCNLKHHERLPCKNRSPESAILPEHWIKMASGKSSRGNRAIACYGCKIDGCIIIKFPFVCMTGYLYDSQRCYLTLGHDSLSPGGSQSKQQYLQNYKRQT